MSFQISLNSNKSTIHREYQPEIRLDGAYEVGLKSFVTYNSIPNISKSLKNNIFAVRDYTTSTLLTLEIADGTYELDDIINVILTSTKFAGTGLKMFLNKNTLRVGVFCSKCSVDFSVKNSVGYILGFGNTRIVPQNAVEYSDLPINIFPINTVRVKCNLIKCNIDDKKLHDNTLYDFPLNNKVGEKIIERPNNISYYRVNSEEIHALFVTIVDQDGKIVDFRGEKISITLAFRPAK